MKNLKATISLQANSEEFRCAMVVTHLKTQCQAEHGYIVLGNDN